MINYPINSTGKVYYDTDGNECTLSQMVRREPEWAMARIREGERKESERDALEKKLEAVRHEARAHAYEARMQRSTVCGIYQLITGASGEPGDWNGVKPVRELVAERDSLQRLADCRREQREALAAHCHLYRQAVFHFNRSRGDINPLLLLMDKEPETSLHRLITEKQVEAFREVAAWMEPTSEKFSGPTYHEAEMVGMEISGPTHCSDARQCMKAGNRAFLEAARIWEYRAKETAA